MISKLKKIFGNKSTNIKSIAFVMICTILARGLGFFREMAIAYKFGTSMYSDAFITALSFPDLLVNGFGSAISTLYVPLYMKAIKESKEEGKRFNSSVTLLLLTIGIIFVLLFSFFPEFFVKLVVSGFDADSMALTVKLARIIIFSIFPILLDAHYKGFTQVRGKYGWCVLFGCFVNIGIIVSLFFVNTETMIILGYATVASNSVYTLAMLIFVLFDEFRYGKTPKFKSQYFRELLIGIIPVIVANLIVEINQVVDKNFASSLTNGTISALNYSQKIINLITAILGTTIGIIFFPKMITKYRESEKDKSGYFSYLLKITSGLGLVVMPILVYVAIFSKEIITILFARGSFDSESIRLTSNALIFYSMCIFGANMQAIWNRVYNGELNTRTPAIVSVISVGMNIGLNFLFTRFMEERGIALATSISSLFTFFALLGIYKFKNKSFPIGKMLLDFAKILIVSVLFGSLYFIKWIHLNSIFTILVSLVGFVVLFVLYGFICKKIKCYYFLKDDASAVAEACGENPAVSGKEDTESSKEEIKEGTDNNDESD